MPPEMTMPSARTTTCEKGGRWGTASAPPRRWGNYGDEIVPQAASSVQTLERVALSRDEARRRAARTRGGARTYHVLALEKLLRDDRGEAAEEVTAAIDDNHLLATRREECGVFG